MSNQRGAKARRKMPSSLGAVAFLAKAGITNASARQTAHLQAALEHVYCGWCWSKQGYEKTSPGPQPTPKDGRPAVYPGLPIPLLNPAPDNQAHLRWSLMFHSSLYEIRVSYFDIADDAGQNPETLYALLSGIRYGRGETRVKATAALWLRMLQEGFTFTTLLAWIAQDGQWLPEGRSRAPQWQLNQNGFAVIRHSNPRPVRRRRRKPAAKRGGSRPRSPGRTPGHRVSGHRTPGRGTGPAGDGKTM